MSWPLSLAQKSSNFRFLLLEKLWSSTDPADSPRSEQKPIEVPYRRFLQSRQPAASRFVQQPTGESSDNVRQVEQAALLGSQRQSAAAGSAEDHRAMPDHQRLPRRSQTNRAFHGRPGS